MKALLCEVYQVFREQRILDAGLCDGTALRVRQQPLPHAQLQHTARALWGGGDARLQSNGDTQGTTMCV